MQIRTLLLTGMLTVPLFTAAGCATTGKTSDTSTQKQAAPEITADDPRVQQAREALMPLKKGLKGALQKAMSEGGPEAAIDVCRIEAPRIAEAASGEGVEVGRTSHRVRNPRNEPTEWMKPWVDAYLSTPREETTWQAKELPDGRFAYVEPIYTEQMCTVCHGTELAPGIKAALAEKYPQDKATGFAEGDLRGMFWVTIEP